MPLKENERRDWHPVYCPLACIIGLESEQDRCKKILKKVRTDGRVVVLLRVSGDWLFGQCNFKLDTADNYDLKFIDKIDVVIGRDLDIFAQRGVDKLIFVEKDLFESFEAKRDRDFETFLMKSILLDE
jgi:hypothetical protein